jgi:beta-galactosidase
VLDHAGNQQGITESMQRIEPGKQSEFAGTVMISRPSTWSPETPVLYTLVNEVYNEGQLTDREEISFGIRTLSVDAVNGFLLNGIPVKLKGGCLHHDNGPLGARAFDRAEERKVELLKASGYNAIRCSHNPPSPALLDACDRLGMMVVDEAFDMWTDAKNPGDYHLYFREWWKKDIESMVLRDRNHPSVIMWSTGNEIPNRTRPDVVAISKALADLVRELDPSRPVLAAVNDLRPDKDPFFATLQVGGYNYAAGGDHLQESIYAQDHARIPERIMLGTESYPLEAFQSWMEVEDHPYVIGDFVWTAWDYIGEASIGWRGYWQEQSFFPWNLAYCGDIDICGWKRPQSHYRDALWKTGQVSLFVAPPVPSFEKNPNRQSWSKWHWHDVVASWNWHGYENVPLGVSVYSSCQRVELFLNGKSLGSRTTDRSTRFMASWEVPYQPGVLKVEGYQGKKKVAEAVLQTAGKPESIRLSADRVRMKADNQDLCYITVLLTDSLGNRNPLAEDLVKFEISGPGALAGVGNANPVSLESYILPQRHAWQGRCMVIVRATREKGTIRLTATAAGLPDAAIEIITD